ncbi:MAG: hypothetical protein V1737_01205 [Chloroflexota bacterium]
MIKLERSESLKRKIRRDDVFDLTVPTWSVIREAIKAGDTKRAPEFLDYELIAIVRGQDSFVKLMDVSLTALARFDEEEENRVPRDRLGDRVKEWPSYLKENLERWTEMHRSLCCVSREILACELRDGYPLKVTLPSRSPKTPAYTTSTSGRS